MGALGIPLRGLANLTARRHRFHDVELSGIVRHGCHVLAIDERRGPFRPSLWAVKPKPGQVVEQVWFSGDHSDVGSSADPVLGSPTFRWMKARASNVGLVLDDAEAEHAAGPTRPQRQRTIGWNPLPQHIRTIGGDPTQSVHATARDRFNQDETYAPVNLATYLREPDARVYGGSRR